MARTTIVQLTDDIDGSQAAETVRFAVDGRTYEIDLSTAHAEGLRHSLEAFIAAARRAAAGPPSTKREYTGAQQASVAEPVTAEPAAAEPAAAGPVPAEAADKPKRSRRKRG